MRHGVRMDPFGTRRSQNFKFIILIAFALLSGLTFSACTHGLEPMSKPPVQPGFGGTIYFASPWPHPPSDSVYDIRVVAFHNYPSQNIFSEVLTGQAKVFPPIGAASPPFFVDSLSYTFDLDSSATFQYVAVAMQYGPNVFTDWKVVGVYGDPLDVGNRESVVVPANTFVNGINIYVNFKNPPPTPPVTSVAAASRKRRFAD